MRNVGKLLLFTKTFLRKLIFQPYCQANVIKGANILFNKQLSDLSYHIRKNEEEGVVLVIYGTPGFYWPFFVRSSSERCL